jgi:hypothetical protein
MMERALFHSVTTRIEEHSYCHAQNTQITQDPENSINLEEKHNGELYNC